MVITILLHIYVLIIIRLFIFLILKQYILLVGREKLFVIPKNVYTYSICCITKGKNSYNVSHEKIFFNHYIFLNKSERGRNITDITDNTISNHCTNLL